MYMSHLLIDVGDDPDRPRPGRIWLRNLYHVHQRLSMAFPSAGRRAEDAEFLKPFRSVDFVGQVHVARGPESGFLFRVDPQAGGRAVIVVQSGLFPDWDYAFHNASYLLAAKPEARSFTPVFADGQQLRFRLVANPTRKIPKDKPGAAKRKGKRVPVREGHLMDWLAQRALPSGFSITVDSTTVQPGYVLMKKPREEGQRLRSARYDGILRVTDSEAMWSSLVRGIGPGKAFGFGLLSVQFVRTEGPEITT